ncbi:MAG: hypothetical protein SGJ10_06825 [Bacteroidota bacterium]|nr:hypothetical protein [Bacteroidota bacterium]
MPNKQYKELGLVFGVHQFNNTYIEAGIAKVKYNSARCAFSSYFKGQSFSVLYNPFQQEIGLSLTTWTSIGTIITAGTNFNSYTDFKNYNIGMMPFIGIGPGQLSLTYGYNVQFINSKVLHVNTHCFSLRYYIKLRKI